MGELKMPAPVVKLHCAPPVVEACTLLSAVCAAFPRNFGQGLPDASGTCGPVGEAGDDEQPAATSATSAARHRGSFIRHNQARNRSRVDRRAPSSPSPTPS